MAKQYELVGVGDYFEFRFPYDPAAVEWLKRNIPGAARKPVYIEKEDGSRKFSHWAISTEYKDDILAMCQSIRQQPVITGEFGAAKTVTKKLRVEYVGLPRDRGGIVTASGAINREWLVTFTLESLKEYFNFNILPSGVQDKYSVLGVRRTASGAEIKDAWKKLVKQWHPDVCTEEDAEKQFIAVQEAYELLKNPLTRRKYDASLKLTDNQPERRKDDVTLGWRPPMRCGWITVEAIETLGKYVVNKIISWDEITENGLTMVTSWDMSLNDYRIDWVNP